MSSSGDGLLSADLETGAQKSNLRRILTIICVDCVLVVILAASIMLYVNLNHTPEIVYPSGMHDAIDKLQQVSVSGTPINQALVDYYVKLYGLAPEGTCVVGEKYGAVCNDGTVTYKRGMDVCVDDGGVKEWAECK